MFALNEAGRWDDPVLVSGTDGVGTKVSRDRPRAAQRAGDLVAMCVNDIRSPALSLFFLDYFATGQLDVDVAERGARYRRCLRARRCALVGGETASRRIYQDGDYDLAGFAVGIAERSALEVPSM